MDPNATFKQVAYRSVVGPPIKIDEEINLLIAAGFELKGHPVLIPDGSGDLVASLVKREQITVPEARKRFTPKPTFNRGRGYSADGR